MKVKRTDSTDMDFRALVKLLDKELAEKDGEDHDFYHQFNHIDAINHCVVITLEGLPVACGAIKQYDETTMEVKRMFTLPEKRGRGFATVLLKELEEWAKEMNFQKCILETGKKQPDAIALYKKNGYSTIKNYGQYAGITNSICFEKEVINRTQSLGGKKKY